MQHFSYPHISSKNVSPTYNSYQDPMCILLSSSVMDQPKQAIALSTEGIFSLDKMPHGRDRVPVHRGYGAKQVVVKHAKVRAGGGLDVNDRVFRFHRIWRNAFGMLAGEVARDGCLSVVCVADYQAAGRSVARRMIQEPLKLHECFGRYGVIDPYVVFDRQILGTE